MADEIELHFHDAGEPDTVLAAWRATPPTALRDGRFEVIDESYNSLTWEARFYDWPAKLMMWASLGLVWLMRGILSLESIWRVTTRFDADGTGTRVTVLGHADERTRILLGEEAAARGGAVGLRVGT